MTRYIAVNNKSVNDKIEPYGREYEDLAYRLARSYCPPIYPCRHCSHPVIQGYCCEHCGSDNPSVRECDDNEQQ
jgi:hypothetical protein